MLVRRDQLVGITHAVRTTTQRRTTTDYAANGYTQWNDHAAAIALLYNEMQPQQKLIGVPTTSCEIDERTNEPTNQRDASERHTERTETGEQARIVGITKVTRQ